VLRLLSRMSSWETVRVPSSQPLQRQQRSQGETAAARLEPPSEKALRNPLVRAAAAMRVLTGHDAPTPTAWRQAVGELQLEAPGTRFEALGLRLRFLQEAQDGQFEAAARAFVRYVRRFYAYGPIRTTCHDGIVSSLTALSRESRLGLLSHLQRGSALEEIAACRLELGRTALLRGELDGDAASRIFDEGVWPQSLKPTAQLYRFAVEMLYGGQRPTDRDLEGLQKVLLRERDEWLRRLLGVLLPVLPLERPGRDVDVESVGGSDVAQNVHARLQRAVGLKVRE
jgi:hypothetical protein